MIKRPLGLVSVVFVLLLLAIRYMELPAFFYSPVSITENGYKSLEGYLQDDVITLYGRVSDYSFQESYSGRTTKLSLKDVSILTKLQEYKKATGIAQSILVYINKEETHFIGSTVLVSGKLSFFEAATNPGQFDAEKYYANKDVLFSLRNAYVIKETGTMRDERGRPIEGVSLPQRLKELAISQEEVLDRYLSKPYATIMKAMLFGNKSELDEELEQLYQDNGIAHILAISGLHISLIGMALYRLLKRLPLPVWIPLCISELFLLLYGCMVGFPISAVRAIGMFTFFLISKLLKRSYDMLTALAFMAMVQLLVHPGYLFDCGFQLSYGAILGMGILLPALEQINASVPILWIRKGISFLLPSLAVTLVTTPILIYHYHEFSLFSVLLNVMVLPFMGVLVLSAIAMLFFSYLFVPIAQICAWVVTAILTFYEYSCRFLEQFPLSQRNIEMPTMFRLIMYFMLLIIMTILVKKKSHIHHFLLVVLSLGLLLFPQNPQFTLWITDVGQGDGSVIFTEEGKCFVIDCGSTDKYRVGERVLIPLLKYQGVDNIDAVFVTHADKDHMSGVVELLEAGMEENIRVDRVIISKAAMEEPMYAAKAAVEELMYAAKAEVEEPMYAAKAEVEEPMYAAKAAKAEANNNYKGCLGDIADGKESRSENMKLHMEERESGKLYTKERGSEWSELFNLARERNIPVIGMSRGDKVQTESLILECLYPLEEQSGLTGNEASLVLGLEVKSGNYNMSGGIIGDVMSKQHFCREAEEDILFRALFTGDLEAEGERLLLQEERKTEERGNYDLLKVAHHGSSGSSTTEFLKWVSPEWAVISCGRTNPYGHPHEETLTRLKKQGARVITTSEIGAVKISTNNGEVSMKTWNK